MIAVHGDNLCTLPLLEVGDNQRLLLVCKLKYYEKSKSTKIPFFVPSFEFRKLLELFLKEDLNYFLLVLENLPQV